MRKGHTEVVCVIDQSGSMEVMKAEAITGFNKFLEEQKKVEGTAALTLVLFNDGYEMAHRHVPIEEVEDLTDQTYITSSTTALLDAIGKTIDSIGNDFRVWPEEHRAEHVVFCVITDGQENASKEYKKGRILEMIKEQTDKWGWKFVFVGAGPEAFSQAGGLGFNLKMSKHVTHDADGITCGMDHFAATVRSVRTGGDGTYDDKDNPTT